MSSVNLCSMANSNRNREDEINDLTDRWKPQVQRRLEQLERLQNNFDPEQLEEIQVKIKEVEERQKTEAKKNKHNMQIVMIFGYLMFLASIVIALLAAPLLNKDFENPAPSLKSRERCFAVSKEFDLDITVTAGEQATALPSVINGVCNLKIPVNSQLDLPCELVLKNSSGCKATFGVNCSVKRINADQYEISYLCLPSVSPGKYQLLIKINGGLIQGDPLNVSVLKNFSMSINTIIDRDKVYAPQGIAFNHMDEIIVAEYKNHSVSIFNTPREKLRLFGSKGSGPREFNHPCAVAVDDEDNILVADGKNHRIQKFTPEGDYMTEVGKHGTESLEFNFPVGIGIHPLTKMIYVTENRNHRIQILYPNLTHFASIGGSGHDQFNEPKDVAFDSTGNVYVADNENHQIQVFTVEGKFKTKFGKQGKERGELDYPSGVSIDSGKDLLYVTELYNYRVSVFTLMGRFLMAFGEKGSGQGQFIDPRGIAVDKNGSIYISDHGNDRIQVYVGVAKTLVISCNCTHK